MTAVVPSYDGVIIPEVVDEMFPHILVATDTVAQNDGKPATHNAIVDGRIIKGSKCLFVHNGPVVSRGVCEKMDATLVGYLLTNS